MHETKFITNFHITNILFITNESISKIVFIINEFKTVVFPTYIYLIIAQFFFL